MGTMTAAQYDALIAVRDGNVTLGAGVRHERPPELDQYALDSTLKRDWWRWPWPIDAGTVAILTPAGEAAIVYYEDRADAEAVRYELCELVGVT